MNHFRLLVVDDDSLIIDAIRLILPSHWQMLSVKDDSHLSDKLNVHAAFVDMHLTSAKLAAGPRIIETIHRENPQIEIVAMSGDLSMELMESCLDKGARKFLPKPFVMEEVLATLEKIEALWKMHALQNRGVNPESVFLGTSPASEKLRLQIASLRGEGGPILIEGETGSGKEVVAQLLHAQELTRPLVTVNVAGITESLFESEMFGHVKGAFTGADQNKVGLAEAAHGGDLFLDEIEALTLPMQVKLLRFLESGELRKVGAKDSVKIKTRVIVASNQKLEQLVEAQKFRADLFFRLNGKTISIPPLRERLEDIAVLAPHFLGLQRPRVNKSLSPEAVKELQNYSWPGNIRELKRICEQLATTCPLPVIRTEDVIALLTPLRSGKSKLPDSELDYQMGLSKLVENFESQVIQGLLKKLKDVDQTAEILKVSRSNLYKKIKDYGITTDH